MATVRISGVTKRFGKKMVLNNIDLNIGTGIHGILGPNGAGKTTLLRCALGLLPYEGEIQIDHTAIGYLPQNFRIFKNLSVEEALLYVVHLKEAKVQDLHDVLSATGLETERKTTVRKLSGGMLRRLGIAQALIGDSRILILDEPAVGLDPLQRVNLRNIIATLGRDRTIILSTHIVDDLSDMADTISIIDKGKLRFHGEQSAFLKDMKDKVGTLSISVEELPEWENRVEILKSITDIRGNLQLSIYADPLPKEARVVEPTLEDGYLHWTGGKNAL